MNEIIMVMLSYLAIIIIAFALINWLQRGLLIAFMRVKTSRGKLVLCKIRGKVEDYYRPGEPKYNGLIVRFKNEKERSTLVSVPSDCFYRSAGVTMIDVDEVSKFAVRKNWTAVSTNDPATTTSLIKRAQMSASEPDKLIIVVIVLCIFIVLGLLIIGVMLNEVKGMIQTGQIAGQIVGGNL